MVKLPDQDYAALDRFVRTVLSLVATGEISIDAGTTTIMHPITAWDNGSRAEFIPWIKSWLEERKVT